MTGGELCEEGLCDSASAPSSTSSPVSSSSSGEEDTAASAMVTQSPSASHHHVQDLPSPDTPQGCKEAFQKYVCQTFLDYYCIVLRCRLTSMIHGLRGDGLEPEVLISNLEYVQEVLGVLAQKAEYVHNLLRPHWYLHFYKQTIETILLFLLTHLQISYWGTWTKP